MDGWLDARLIQGSGAAKVPKQMQKNPMVRVYRVYVTILKKTFSSSEYKNFFNLSDYSVNAS